MKIQHTEKFVMTVSKLPWQHNNGGKADDPVPILKPSPANGLRHLRCFSIDSFQNYFCHSKLHINSQMSFLDVIMPLCNHSFHSAMPQEACLSGFLYLDIQVTWACWYWKEKKKKDTTVQQKKINSKDFWLKLLKRSHLWKKTSLCWLTVLLSIWIYCRKLSCFFTSVSCNTII